MKKTHWRRYAPTAENIEAVRSALCSHWVMATHAVPQTPFWAQPDSWLHRQAYHFTSGGRLIR